MLNCNSVTNCSDANSSWAAGERQDARPPARLCVLPPGWTCFWISPNRRAGSTQENAGPAVGQTEGSRGLKCRCCVITPTLAAGTSASGFRRRRDGAEDLMAQPFCCVAAHVSFYTSKLYLTFPNPFLRSTTYFPPPTQTLRFSCRCVVLVSRGTI